MGTGPRGKLDVSGHVFGGGGGGGGKRRLVTFRPKEVLSLPPTPQHSYIPSASGRGLSLSFSSGEEGS